MFFWNSLASSIIQQFSWVAQSCPIFATPWITARQAYLSITNTRSLLKLTSIESVIPSSHLILRHPHVLLPPIPPSIRIFSNESSLHMRWPKFWSFSFSIIPSNEPLGLISFRWTGWISLQSKGLSRVFSNTTVQNHQFFGAQLSSQSNSHIHTWRSITQPLNKKCLLLGKKVMINPDNMLKNRYFFSNTGTFSQGYGFSSSHVWMWELEYKNSWAPKNWWFWTVLLEKTFESPSDSRRSNQSILKEISPEYLLEGLMLKLKL